MTRVTIDGFVLRFPRTGIVNYVFNVVSELQRKSDVDLTVLLEDANFADAEIARYVASSLQTRMVAPLVRTGPIGRLKERVRNRNLSVRLPHPREIERMVEPGDIYHATDWYHYASPHARLNVLTYFDLTTKLHSKFHEHTNIVKEKRKAASIRNFDRVVAISHSTRKDLIDHYGVPPEKISVSHLGVDRVYESPSVRPRAAFLKEYGIDPSRRYILSVSTIEPRKNIIGILNAYRTLCDMGRDYRETLLVLSGPMGWRNEGLKNFIDAFPYRDNIVFPGYVPLEQMPSLYRHAEAFVYLSFYEGFGIPILEAMKSSCPVVSSNTSSMPEVLGDAGELVSPHAPEDAAAALARLLDDPFHADAARFAGLARSRNFTWNRHVEDLIQIYGIT